MDRIEEFRQDERVSMPLAEAGWESQGELFPVTQNLPVPVPGYLPVAAEPAAEPAILVENLGKQYGSQWAVDDVSFSVPRGATVGLLGGNGAGKTTTIAMIMGLVIPTIGRASVLGHDMARSRFKVLKRMNFESPYVAMPAKLSVRENLTVFGRLYGVPQLKSRITELVEEFDLGDVLDQATGQLSAGQKTRVSVAKALLNDPEVLLLDEPTASLDPDRAEWVRACLRKYQRRRNAAILLSSHNMHEVEELCDYVVIMSYGRIAEIGAPQELIRRYECDSLDEVFFVIAREQEEGEGEHWQDDAS
ncbi:ABC-2 type transport system ATP-binding protein [Rhizobiales bacterium GAS191]|nr:ABC-2 type transport system ATP-binding protein [Rhizobiales bacterium GAS113]SEC74959.1 ABC-2 type transport system ATP-binding protein [Rhizobiales bacterium GAS191]